MDQYKFSGNSLILIHILAEASIRKFASQSEENLKNSALNGNRRYPPSTTEIRAIEEKRTIHFNFHFMGGHNRMMEIHSGTTAANALKELLLHAEIKDITGWALYISDDMTGKNDIY
jgi:hypothetical protein